MKRSLSFFLVLFALLLAQISPAAAEYEPYLDGDTNLIICGGHMGTAKYVDCNSIKADTPRPDVRTLSFCVYTVRDADRGNTEPSNSAYVKYLYDLKKTRMYRLGQDGEWHYVKPIGSMAATGHFFDGELAYYYAFNSKFYGGHRWWDERMQRYMSPNFGDGLYAPIDDLR